MNCKSVSRSGFFARLYLGQHGRREIAGPRLPADTKLDVIRFDIELNRVQRQAVSRPGFHTVSLKCRGELGVIECESPFALHGIHQNVLATPAWQLVPVPEMIASVEPSHTDRRLVDTASTASPGAALLRSRGFDAIVGNEVRIASIP
jgi:hypothetical protein